MSPIRRSPRNLVRRSNPARDIVAERQRALELARSRERPAKPGTDLPTLVQSQVAEHMDKLQNKLITDFRAMGKRAIEESTSVLNEQLSDRINALEAVSTQQTNTLGRLRDSSKVAEQRVSSAVNSIEKSLSAAVPGGFKLPPSSYTRPASAFIPQTVIGYGHPQFQLESRTEIIKADPREIEGMTDRYGFCPSCTSTDIRRSNRQGLFEQFLRLFFIAPFRCRACRHKFYKF